MLRTVILVILGSLIVGGLLGAGVGGLLGRLMPGYYKGIFADPHDPDFNAVQVGLGLGMTQGMIFGAVIGLGISAIVAWHEVRTKG